MNALARLIDKTLPLNRKELYFTGTVFPMIVCRDNFEHFGKLLPLVGLGGLQNGTAWGPENLVFYTEYSLQESLCGDDRARFSNLPATKDTPDIVIYLNEPRPYIIAFEAKMFHNPSAQRLQEQMDGQRQFLDAMQTALGAECVHYALLPKPLLDAYDGNFTGKAITWQQLAEAFNGNGPDYFLDVLNLALTRYEQLVSPAELSFGQNSDGIQSGLELYTRFQSGDRRVKSVGRLGGLYGMAFTQDLDESRWQYQRYEYSASLPQNRNWFTIQEFVTAIEKKG